MGATKSHRVSSQVSSRVESRRHWWRVPLKDFVLCEEFSLTRMRVAIQSSEVVTAIVASVLVPVLLLSFVVAVTAGFGIISAERPLSMSLLAFLALKVSCLAVLSLAVIVVSLVTIFVWLGIDLFLRSFSVAASCVCAGTAILFSYLYYLQFIVLVSLQGATAPIGVTLTTAFSLTFLYLFYSHALLTAVLWRRERLALSAMTLGQPYWRTLLDPLTLRYGHRSNARRHALTAVILFTSRAVHGASVILLAFAFGGLFFTLASTPAVLVKVFDKSGTGAATGLPWGLVRAVLLLYVVISLITIATVRVAVMLRRTAQWLTRASYESLTRSDERRPILFLRHFANDQVTLPSSPLLLKHLLAEPGRRRLDHELVERFSIFGPVVAVGRPGETELPFGAARVYVPDADWQPKVLELAERAAAIVLVADESAGINWEVQSMIEPPFLEKTLFLAPPGGDGELLRNHTVLGPILAAQPLPRGDFMPLGAYVVEGHWKQLCVKQVTGYDYVACCKAFFGLRARLVVADRKQNPSDSR